MSPYLTMMNFLVKSSKAKMMCETRTPRTIRARADLTTIIRIKSTMMVTMMMMMMIMTIMNRTMTGDNLITMVAKGHFFAPVHHPV